MKKLLFAIAGAASFAALAADPTPGANDIDVLGFENFDLTDTANVSGAVVERTDSGIGGTSKWSCSGDDASLVKTYGGDNAAKGNGLTFPGPFEDEGDQYLALDTNGAELQRTVGATVAAAGTYIDTLVQFTPSESDPTSTDLTSAKLAIWLKADSEHNTTNLMVQGSFWDFDSSPNGTSQAFALTGKTIEPGTWYRLTVKAIPNFMNEDSGMSIPAFQILVDGTEMTLATAPLSAGFLAILDQSSMYASADIEAAMTANKLVPSIQTEAGAYGATVTLTSVGFKGTGAIDDFVVTTEDPGFTPAPVDFTLTWPAGFTGVKYKIGDGEWVNINGNSPLGIGQVGAGTNVQFVVQNADGAQKTLNANGEENGIDATGTTFGWPEYLGEAVNGAYEIDDAAELVLFQKGVAAGLTTASTTFKLTDDVTLTAPWPGVGIQNGKDLAATDAGAEKNAQYEAGAFKGIFDGQNHTVSGFQMAGGNLDYCGFFNSIYGAKIQNLTISYLGSTFATDTTSSTEESGATFVGVAKNSSVLSNLTASAASTVSCAKGIGGIVGYTMGGTLVADCTNNVSLTSLLQNKAGGISMIVQGGSGAVIRNCKNTGTISGGGASIGAGKGGTGGIAGYIGADMTIDSCTDDSATGQSFARHVGGTVTMQGVNKARAGVPAYEGGVIDGLAFATVADSVATFVSTNAFALSGSYKVMGPSATAEFAFAEAGSISFDTNLIQAVTFAITAAQGLDVPTETTENGVVTFTVGSSSTPLHPGENDGETYTSEADALAAAAGVTIEASDAVATALGADTDTYEARFEAQAVEVSAGVWNVVIGLKATEEAALQTQADGDAGAVVGALGGNSVTVNTTPGFYYSVKYGSALNAINYQTAGELATGNTKSITLPAKSGTAGFYKVVISITPSEAVAPQN